MSDSHSLQLDDSDSNDQALAGQIIIACNAALRVFRIHSTDNDAVTKPLEMLSTTLEALSSRHQRVAIGQVEGVFYFGDSQVRLSAAHQQIGDQLALELKNRLLGGVVFDGVPAMRQLVTFFTVLNESEQNDRADANSVRRALRRAGVADVGVTGILRAITKSNEEKSPTDRAAAVYSAAIKHAASIYVPGGAFRRGAARTKRIVQEFVDLAHADPTVLIALAGLRGTGSEAAEHAVCVAVLSIALGKRLGLPKNLLADLGAAGLYHDTGLNALGPTEQSDTSQHPYLAFKALLQQSHTGDSALRQLLIAFEHHRDFAGGGQPRLQFRGTPYPLAQIVRLANDFDGYTRGRRGREPMEVGGALARLERGKEIQYHPALTKAFVEIVGGIADEEAPEPAQEDEPAGGALDLMLADFLGKKVEPDKPKVKPKAKAKPKNALGVLKLKKIRRQR